MKESTRWCCAVLFLFSITAHSEEWTVRWPLGYDGWRVPEVKMTVDGTNGIYTLSHADRIGTLDKWSPAGQKLWSRLISSNSAHLGNIVIESNGNVWAGAYADLFRFAPDGTQLQHLTIGSYGVYALALAPDAIFIATYDALTRRPLTGFGSWNVSIGGEAVALDSVGDALVSSQAGGSWMTRKISAAGMDLWWSNDGGDLAVSLSNSVALAIRTGPPVYEVVKLSATGSPLWRRRYVAPMTSSERTSQVLTDPAGNIYVTGSSGTGYDHGDIVTTKYSPAGELLWANRLKVASYYDHSTLIGDMAISSNQLIAVTGADYFGADEASVGVLTVVYDANGNRVWMARDDAELATFYGGQAVAFDPVGNLYVAGTLGRTDTEGYFLKKYPALHLSGLPVIGQPPSNTLASIGQRVTFSVNASGALHYQWLRNDEPISGATNSTITFTNVQRMDAAEFAVAISNAAGTIVSPVGRLWFPPEIIAPPRNFHLAAGDVAGLEIDVPWNNYLRYEWWRDGVVLSNATTARLMVTNSGGNAYGDYTVRVIDPFGATSTASAWIRPLQGVDLVWSQRQYDASEPIGVVSLPDGNVFMAGNEYRTGQPDYFILKRYGANGEDGLRIYYSPSRDAVAVKLLVGSDGDLYVAGHAQSLTGDLDFLLVRFDTNGVVRSDFRWDSGFAKDDLVVACEQDDQGALYLVGNARRSSGSNEIVVLKISQGTNVVWNTTVPQVSNHSQYVLAASLDPARNLYLGANHFLPGAASRETVALSPQGVIRWRRQSGPAMAVDGIAACTDGVCIVGWGGITRFDANGNEVWNRIYVGNGMAIYPTAVLCAPDGAIYIGGGVTARLDGSDGSIQWLSTTAENTRRLVLDPAANQLYAIESTRSLMALRASDGLAVWHVMYGDKYGDYAQTIGASLHSSGDLLVSSPARDGSVDSLTRRFHSTVSAFPDVSSNRVVYARSGNTITLSESVAPIVSMQKRWRRGRDAILGETNGTLTLSPMRPRDGALYSLEAWDNNQSLQFPAWNVLFQPALQAHSFISESEFYFSASTEVPQDATFYLQSSTDLIHWTSITTNDFSPPPQDWPSGTSARFFRLVLP
jgi:hypothetical protein